MEKDFKRAPEISTLLNLYAKIAKDPRVNVWQISLFTFILLLWQKGGYKTDIKVSRKQLMAGAHFGSVTTYHKCINQLKEYKYIVYIPTYDPNEGSVVKVIV